MKATDALTFLISVNIMISIATSLGIWSVSGITGVTPEEAISGMEGETKTIINSDGNPEEISDMSNINIATVSGIVVGLIAALIGALLITKLFPYAHHGVIYALLGGVFIGLWTANAQLITTVEPYFSGIPISGIFYLMGIFLFIMLMAQCVLGGMKSYE